MLHGSSITLLNGLEGPDNIPRTLCSGWANTFRRAMLSSDSSCFLTKHLKNLDPSYKTNLDLWDYQFSESLDLLNTLHICYRHFEDVHEAV